MNRLAGKWYVSEEKAVKDLGNLEAEFKSNGTFDIYNSESIEMDDDGFGCIS